MVGRKSSGIRRGISAGFGALIAIASTGILLAVTPQVASAAPLWTAETSTFGAGYHTGVSFPTATDGFATVGVNGIIGTTDAGENWTGEFNPGSTFNAISASSPMDAIAVGNAGAVAYTSDGGSTWATTTPTAHALTGVDMLNANDGWAVGFSDTLLFTTDGGATWTAATSSPNNDYFGVSFANVSDGWAVGQGGIIVATIDGGVHWTKQAGIAGIQFNAVSFADASHGHAVGSNGAIYTTIDGGTTWIAQNSGTTSDLFGVSFSSDSIGWAVGAGGLILGTTDNGATWTPETSGTTNQLNAVSSPDPTHAWTVGAAGTILAYSNPNTNAVTQFAVTTSSTDVTAGSIAPQLTVTVKAEDAGGVVVPGYLGTVHFTSTDPQATLPVNATLTNGVGTFNVTLKTATQPDEAAPAPAAQTISVTDINVPALTGTTPNIEVDPAAATHLAVTGDPYPTALPATEPAGTTFVAEVTALDAFGNIDTTNVTSVHLTSSDPAFPLDTIVLVAGQKVASGISLSTAGSQTLTATDVTTPTLTGTSTPILVTPAAATHFVVSAPANVTAGVPFSFTVTAEDALNNVQPGYAGTVSFGPLTLGGTVTPTSATLTNGVGTFTGEFTTAGSTSITATDGTHNGASGTITVSAAGVTHLAVTGVPGSSAAGTPFTFAVTAEDALNNTVTTDDSIVTFISTDPQAVLPLTVTLVAGVATGISGTFDTVGGAQTITATEQPDTTVVGTSSPDNVTAGTPTHFSVTAPATATAGVGFTATVTALDAFGNVANLNSGINVSSTDPAAGGIGSSFVMTAGTASVPVTLNTAGSQTLSANCTCLGGYSGTSAPILVSPAAASGLVVTAPGTVTVGVPFTFTVQAVDSHGNTVTNFTDPVAFTSSDGQAVLPGTSNVTNGLATFTATLKTTGSQTLTVTDTLHAGVTGQATITVDAATATHLVLTDSGSATAGSSFPLTVTAEDAFGNTATGDTDTIAFTSSDGAAVLPPNTALVAGVATVTPTLDTAGPQTITATDTTTHVSAVTTIVVSAASAGTIHLVVSAPGTTTAGTAFPITVTAEDAFNNVDPAFTGSVQITSSDLQATLPPNATLTNGVGTFSVTLGTAGSQSVTASDVTTVATPGSATVVVTPGPAVSLSFNPLPTPDTAGIGFSVTVKALDAFQNVVTSFSDNVGITSTDPQAVLPPNAHLVNGVGTFNLTLKTAGPQNVFATDLVTPSIKATGSVTVLSAPASRLIISGPSTTRADQTFGVTVTAEDPFGNVAKTPTTAPVTFSTSSALSVLPAGTQDLTNGVGNFTIQLESAGMQTLTANLVTDPSVTGSLNVAVLPGFATSFSVVAPATEQAGTPIAFTVTALDAFGNTDTSFPNPVHFTSTQPGATLPANTTLTNGVGTFSATFTKTGTQVITANSTDHLAHAIASPSGPILVTPAPANHFTLTTPASTLAANPFTFTVMAFDQFNNVATQDFDFIHVLSSDSQALLPNNVGLTAGVGTYSATLYTVGLQTLSVTDYINTAITKTNGILVLPGPATHFIVSAPPTAVAGTPFSVTVTAYDAHGNVADTYTGTVHITSSDPLAILPANKTLTNGVGTFTLTMKTPGDESITATDTAVPSITGTAALVLVYPAPVAGYDLAGSDGGVFSIGAEPFLGSLGGHLLNKPIVGIAMTPTGLGYWLVAADGGVFSFGDAAFYGSTGAIHLNQPIVGMASTPDGKGYWLVASDGGIFSFGDAHFYGSTGSLVLNKPIVGMAAMPDGKGYLIVASDGGIFAFGDARFYGSMGSQVLNQPIVGMAISFDGNGYWLVAKDGGIFTFGDATFDGSLPQMNASVNPIQSANVDDVVGIAATSDARGYWVVERDDTVHSFGDASQFGPPLNTTGFGPNNIVGIATGPSTKEAF